MSAGAPSRDSTGGAGAQARPERHKLSLVREDEEKEREADRLADAVLADSRPAVRPGQVADFPAGRPRWVRSDVAAAPSPTGEPGAALSVATRSYFEPRFGRDLSAVRIHSGERAAELADSAEARAFAVGPHILFGEDEFEPDSAAGRALLAHEIAHVLQQAELARPFVQRRKRRKADQAKGKPSIDSIVAVSGAATGTAVLSNGQEVTLNLSKNTKPPGQYRLIHVSGGHYVSLQTEGDSGKGRSFLWRNPRNDRTGELTYSWAETVDVTVLATPQQRIDGLPDHVRKFLTTGAGPLSSNEDIERTAQAGALLAEAGVTEDELTLLEEQARVDRDMSSGGADSREDSLTWAQNYLVGRASERRETTENWDDLIGLCKRLESEPLHLTELGGLGSLLSTGNETVTKLNRFYVAAHYSRLGLRRLPRDKKSRDATAKAWLEAFQALLRSFERLLLKDLKHRGKAALDAADASILRMDRTFVGIWQSSVESPNFFYAELERINSRPIIRHATAKRDLKKAAIDAEDEADLDAIRDPLTRIPNPLQYLGYLQRKDSRSDRKANIDKAFTEVVTASTRLKLPAGVDARKILGATSPQEAQTLLKTYMVDGREMVRKARGKINEPRVIFAADIWVDAEKAALQEKLPGRLGSEIAILIDAFASLRRSETDFWDDLFRVLEFVAMFVPGPVGWGLRAGTALYRLNNTMEELGTQSTLYGAGASSVAPSDDAALWALSEAALDLLPDGSSARKAATLERGAADAVEHKATHSADDVAQAAGDAGKVSPPPGGTSSHIDDAGAPPGHGDGAARGAADEAPQDMRGIVRPGGAIEMRGAHDNLIFDLDELRTRQLDLERRQAGLADDLNSTEHAIADLRERVEKVNAERPRPKGQEGKPRAIETNLQALEEKARKQRETLAELENQLAGARSDLDQVTPPGEAIPQMPASPIGSLDVPSTGPTTYRGSRMHSWHTDVFVATSTSNYRPNVETLLNKNPNGALSTALLENGHIVPHTPDAGVIAADPRIFVAGHARTKAGAKLVGDKEVIILTSARRNAEFSARLEQTGERMSEFAYVIDGIAVEPRTAWDLVDSNRLPRSAVEAAERLPIGKL